MSNHPNKLTKNPTLKVVGAESVRKARSMKRNPRRGAKKRVHSWCTSLRRIGAFSSMTPPNGPGELISKFVNNGAGHKPIGFSSDMSTKSQQENLKEIQRFSTSP